ncbi:FecR family protein [Methylophilus rhizosphaerae]|uniref:FecR family protein n=1 Tax=Methylophilus rhizosphaerae TaxID=492660 RepID=A0A1G8ZQL4_9PROT|nr:FecR domain-containing protein [Methylophilus rhizosphaerae]SDK17392.1 FecR family protein [Methylophilus rhizosphaerae]
MSQALDQTALQQAAEWFAVLSDKQIDESDRLAWQAWLAASPRHHSAWKEVEAINASFNKLNTVSSKTASHQALSHPNSRRQALKVLGFAGVALFGGVMLKRYSPWQDWLTTLTASAKTYSPPPGKTATVVLADASRLWLNANSQAKVEYGLMLRRITVLAGEVLLQSGHDDQDRALVVDTRHGRMTALGTRFTVRQETGRTLLAVYDGRVAITTPQGESIIVPAGNQAYFDTQKISPLEPALSAREAWTRGILIADNQHLDDFIAELSNYYPRRISVSPSVAHFRLMGAYPFSNVPLVLQEIANSLPIRVQNDAQGNFELKPLN